MSISSLGFFVLLALKPRSAADSFRPRNLDLFFTSISAATVSSMLTVEMEVLSNSQLLILALLMFTGGEVFTSMFGLFIKQFTLKKSQRKVASVNSDVLSSPNPSCNLEETELSTIVIVPPQNGKIDHESFDLWYLKYSSIKYLAYVVLGYLLIVHIFGITMVFLYLIIITSAREVLNNKDLKLLTFSIFTTVSTFASCGFIPTNENMMIFSKNSGLLLILIPQVLLGNTLFPSFLRFSIWVLGKLNVKKEESNYLLMKSWEIKYLHLLPSLHSSLLVPSVFGFILVQFILFGSMEWSSEALSGLNSYQKIIGSLFQCVNTRHTGETIVDLSIISPAILVLFVVMM
ncbi:Sodium transporter HKT1 [Morus notabilis]|uniref:Sodium transporter HKT1 n=3 Tax=Morus notabilis TaxID=981085 RepID=W9QZ61_9ROSA|nr:Sodium transporter HKT1 [Morus notabilis]